MIKRLLIFIALLGLHLPLAAQQNPSNLTPKAAANLTRAKTLFTRQQYNAAISAYKSYLRQNKGDTDAWNQLAVAFYHTGQINPALRLLQKYENRTAIKSYNQYYQGMIYLTLQKTEKAKIFLTRSAQYNDEYAARSVFELAILEYHARDKTKTWYWINLYRQRYPQGPALATINRMDQSLRIDSHIAGLRGNDRPNLDKALYTYHPYSLSERPHYWFLQLGYLGEFGTQADPDADKGIKQSNFEDYDLKINTGIGLGPIRSNNTTSWVGYNYKQDWLSDHDRFNKFLDTFSNLSDFTDIFRNFPFRPDLLERTHQLYGDFSYLFHKNFFAGIYAQQDFKFAGTSLIPQEDDIDQKSEKISDTSLFIPQVGFNYGNDFQTILYLYMRKEIFEDGKEFSNKTYSLFGSDEAVFSYGLSQRMRFPHYQLNLNFELFQFQYIYNDHYNSFNRLGFLTGAEYEVHPRFWVKVLLGMYEDVYELEIPRQDGCGFEPAKSKKSVQPENCARKDSGLMYGLGLYWDYSQFSRFEVNYQVIENKNPDLKAYDRSKQSVLVMATFAFPSVRKVMRFIERFGNIAYTKDPET